MVFEEINKYSQKMIIYEYLLIKPHHRALRTSRDLLEYLEGTKIINHATPGTLNENLE